MRKTYTFVKDGRVSTIVSVCVHCCWVAGCVGIRAFAIVLHGLLLQVEEIVIKVLLSVHPLSVDCCFHV